MPWPSHLSAVIMAVPGFAARTATLAAYLAGQPDARVGPGAGEADWVRVTRGTSRPVGRDPDREAGRVRLDHLAVADHQRDMARRGGGAVGTREEHQVARLFMTGRHPRTPDPLLLGGARDVDVGRPVGHHHQSRAVERVRPGAAPQ